MNQKVLIFALALTAIVLVGVAFTEIGSLKKHRQLNSVQTYDKQMENLCKNYVYQSDLTQTQVEAIKPAQDQMCQLFKHERMAKKQTVIQQFDEKCSQGLKLSAGERQLCSLYNKLVNATSEIAKTKTFADYEQDINLRCKLDQKPRVPFTDDKGAKTDLELLCQDIINQRKVQTTTTNYKLVQNGGLFDQNPVVSSNTKPNANQKSVVTSNDNPAAKSVNTNTNNYQQLPMWYMMGGDQEEILKWQMYNNMLNSNGGRL